MSSCPKFHVLTAKRRDLAIAKPCLNGDQQQRPVPLADPRFRVGRCHKRRSFLLSQKRHRAAIISFRRYGQNSLAVQRQSRLADSYISEEGVQGRQAIVARSGTITRLRSRCSRNFPTKGASISSVRSWDGARRRCFEAKWSNNRKVSRYAAIVCGLTPSCVRKRSVKKS